MTPHPDSCLDRLSELAALTQETAGIPTVIQTKCRDTARRPPCGAESRQTSRRNGGFTGARHDRRDPTRPTPELRHQSRHDVAIIPSVIRHLKRVADGDRREAPREPNGQPANGGGARGGTQPRGERTMNRLTTTLCEQQTESARLYATIAANPSRPARTNRVAARSRKSRRSTHCENA